MRERKSNRLKGFDYSSSGYYFVTICTLNRKEWFGEIGNGQMIPNTYGTIAQSPWEEIPNHFERVGVDEFTVMPNHIHGIMIIEKDVGNASMRSLQDRTKMRLSKIIQQYKAAVTRDIHWFRKDLCFKWQKSFYDHVIRNETELFRIRGYIQNNPLKWGLDRENPSARTFNLSHDLYWKDIYDPVGATRELSRPKKYESQ
jgi:putative transposase